ncbi:hypothetical protein V6243_06515 [Cobetia marina]|uniref:Uncharacterized protein n=1 Tax=Cobetia marina TaxID=28258 RepID=A0ABU9GEC5_COBMA
MKNKFKNKIIELDTREQWRKDFLGTTWIYENCLFNNEKFSIKKVSGLSLFCYELKRVYAEYAFIFKVMMGKENGQLIKDFDLDCKSVSSAIKRYKIEILELNIFLKIFLFPVMLGVLFTVSVFLFLRSIYTVFRQVYRRVMSSRVLGSFNSAVDEDVIIIYSKRIPKQAECVVEAVITHEHFHFIQYKYTECHALRIKHVDKDSVNRIFSINDDSHKFYMYLLDSKEFEARLHEMLLCYFRTTGRFPESIDELEICYLEYIYGKSFEVNDIDSDRDFFFRSESLSLDLFSIYTHVKDEYQDIFMTEVVGVLYGNMLDYYGLDEKARSIRLEIPAPNISDFIYRSNVAR